MSVIRVGSTSKYAENWAAIFGGKGAKKPGGKKPAAKKTKAVKKPAARQAKKKRR